MNDRRAPPDAARPRPHPDRKSRSGCALPIAREPGPTEFRGPNPSGQAFDDSDAVGMAVDPEDEAKITFAARFEKPVLAATFNNIPPNAVGAVFGLEMNGRPLASLIGQFADADGKLAIVKRFDSDAPKKFVAHLPLAAADLSPRGRQWPGAATGALLFSEKGPAIKRNCPARICVPARPFSPIFWFEPAVAIMCKLGRESGWPLASTAKLAAMHFRRFLPLGRAEFADLREIVMRCYERPGSVPQEAGNLRARCMPTPALQDFLSYLLVVFLRRQRGAERGDNAALFVAKYMGLSDNEAREAIMAAESFNPAAPAPLVAELWNFSRTTASGSAIVPAAPSAAPEGPGAPDPNPNKDPNQNPDLKRIRGSGG